MKARIERGELAAMLDLVAPAVMTRGAALPILSCVRIDVARKAVTFTTSNLDLTIAAQCTVGDDAGKGTAIVPHRLLSQAVAKMGDGAIGLDYDGGTLTVSGWPGKVTMRAANADNWPKVTADIEGAEVKLEPADVASLARILPFASTDLIRVGLACVTFGDGKAVASDSYRLAAVEIDAHVPPCKVPTDALNAALKAADGGTLVATFGDRAATFATDRASWTVTLIAEDEPSVERMESLFGEVDQALTVNREALIAALDLVGVAAGTGERVVRLTAADGTLSLSLTAQDVGDAAAELKADGTIGATSDGLKLSGDYLRSVCQAAQGETVTLASLDHLRPVHVTEGATRMLVMPMR